MFEKRFSSPLLPLFLVVFIDILGFGIIIPIIGVLFLDASYGLFPAGTALATKTFFLGLFLSSYAICTFFSAPILGILSDKYGRKRLLLLSIAGTFIGYAIIAFGIMQRDLGLMFLGRIIDGLTGGNISIAQSAIADLSDAKSKVKNFGLIGMAFGLGFIAGPFIGGKLADPSVLPWFDFTTPFWFAALLSLGNMLLLWLVFKETLHVRRNARVDILVGMRNIKRAFEMPNLRSMFLVMLLYAMGFSLFNQFFQVFLIEKFHFNQSQIGDFFAFMGVCVALTQGFVTGWVSARFKPAQVLTVALPAMALVMLLMLAPTQASEIYLLIPLVALFQGLSFPNAVAIISNLSSRDSQGEILGLNSSIQSLGMAVPPVMAGLVAGVHFALPTLVASALILLAWLVFNFVFKPKCRNQALFHEEQC